MRHVQSLMPTEMFKELMKLRRASMRIHDDFDQKRMYAEEVSGDSGVVYVEKSMEQARATVDFCNAVASGHLLDAIRLHGTVRDCDLELLDLAADTEDRYTYVDEECWTKQQRKKVEAWKAAFYVNEAGVPLAPPSFVKFGFKEGAQCAIGSAMPMNNDNRKYALDMLAAALREIGQ